MDLDTETIKKEILTIPASRFNTKTIIPTDIKRIKSGRKNYNYLFLINKKKYILRINQFGDYEHSKDEYFNLKLVNDLLVNDGCYPVPICVKKQGRYIKSPYLVITYLEGKNVVLDKNNTLKLAKESVKINSVKLTKNYPFLRKSNYTEIIERLKEKEEEISKYSVPLGKMLIEVRQNIEKLKTSEIKDVYKLMHGDLGEENVLIYKNKLRFIDFEYLKIGDPILDIAKLSFTRHFRKFENVFFKEYIRLTNDITVKNKYEFYRHLQKYSWFVADIKGAIKSKKLKLKLIDKSQKIKDIKMSYNYLNKHKLIKEDLNYIIDILDL